MSSCRWWRENEEMRRTLLALGLGQLASFDFAILTFSASLVSAQVDAPLTMSVIPYAAMAVVYGSIMLYRRRKLLIPWYWYLLLGSVSLHGNYLVNKAYQFTSITSVTILNSWTIAWTIILTWVFLGTKYSPWQFAGAAICVGGLGLVLVSDAGVGGGGGSNPVLGDFLVITGSVLFSLSSVGEEYCVKRKDRLEVLSMMGVFGMLVSAVEIPVLERNNLATMQWSAGLLSAYAVYAVSSFLFSTLIPSVLKMSGAAFFCLSMLTSDMWAVVIRVDWLYYLAFFLVVVGIFIYAKTEKNPSNWRTFRVLAMHYYKKQLFQCHVIATSKLGEILKIFLECLVRTHVNCRRRRRIFIGPNDRFLPFIFNDHIMQNNTCSPVALYSLSDIVPP